MKIFKLNFVIIILLYKNMNPKIDLFIEDDSKVYKTKPSIGSVGLAAGPLTKYFSRFSKCL